MKYIFFLGHQPHLSLAELEAVYGSNSILENDEIYAVMELEEEPNINQLGGTTKISQILRTESLKENVKNQLEKLILDFISEQKTDKLKLGVSIYSGTKINQLNQKDVQELLEKVRKKARKQNQDLNLRTVEPKSPTLNTAQIIHSGLLKTNGASLDIIISEKEVILARTIEVPNLRKYTLRDYGKPRPSGKNGMLPPKLAQIMINLSGAKPEDTILDPFCGSGTVLQEAMLLGIDSVGTDLNTQIISDARENLDWLSKKFGLDTNFGVSVADATAHQWSDKFNKVVCESYLGTPMTNIPTEAKLQSIINECNSVAEGFLKNLRAQINEEATIVYALPCWFIENKIIKLPVVENLSALGYNKVKSKKISADLVYRRTGEDKNQIVGRDIYILKSK